VYLLFHFFSNKNRTNEGGTEHAYMRYARGEMPEFL
jgi:hypothetical protein